MNKIIAFVFSIFFLFSCNNKQEKDINYNQVIYKPRYTSNFSIQGSECSSSGNTLISVSNPWQGAENITTSLLVNRDSNFKGEKDSSSLMGEAKRIVCMSSTHIAILDALKSADRIVGVSGKQYISNPSIAGNQEIIDIGYEGNIDYESLIALKPDLVLLFSINGASSMENKLKEFGIPYLYVGDYLEENPLGKAEWIVAIAETVGKRKEGEELFKNIEKNYLELQNMVDTLKLDRPKVMVNAPFTGSWFMPSTQSYVARLLKDAGADYIYKKNTGSSSLPIDEEEALYLLHDADYWINIGNYNSISELSQQLPKFMNVDCVKENRLYNNNLRSTIGGGNDCYESGIVNPNIILRDLIKIFHPQLIKDDLFYYQHLK